MKGMDGEGTYIAICDDNQLGLNKWDSIVNDEIVSH